MKKILFLDIDDTLLISDNMFIYLYNNDKNNYIKLSTQEYCNYNLNELKNYNIDFRDFDNPNKIKESLINGKPILKNLKIIEKYIMDGWELGILTARGEEYIIKKYIKKWLNKHLKINYKLDIKNIYAVGDKKLKNYYYGNNTNYKKFFILKKYLSKFDKVCLIDDSKKTCEIIQNFNYLNNTIQNINFINV